VRAITIPRHGGPEVLTIADVPDPQPGPDEILVRVEHAAVNRADVLQRMGGYPDPVRRGVEIPGLEYAGTVASAGERVTAWSVGDQVMGIESGACYAEYVVTHERQALPVRPSLPLASAAAVPEVFLTAWDALVVQGGLTSGRWALVHAGGSGVGTAAIQIAKAIGARIAVTCSARKIASCQALGADLVLERSPWDWLAGLRDEVPDGVHVVLDVIGGDEVERNLQAVRGQGSIVQVGLMGGGRADVPVGLLLMKRITWIGTTLRARPLEQKLAVCQRFATEVLPLFDSGALRPVIDSRYPLEQASDAHRHMESDGNVGKILLDVVT
jgi:putative PIG3 family NAD(P)H quinone oxidoreductase